MRTLPRLTEELRSRCLIEAGLAFPAEDANRLEQAKGPKSVGVGRVLRGLERHLHVRLRGEVINLVWVRFLHNANDVGRIGHVAIMHMKGNTLLVRIVNQVVYTLGIER